MKYVLTTILFLLFLIGTSHAVVIKNIKINNNKRITEETIITYGNIELNKEYNQKELNNIVKDLSLIHI
mgnify:CR=1 FL=1